MADQDSFPVGQAPWDEAGHSDPHPDSFPVGKAPWESSAAEPAAQKPNMDQQIKDQTRSYMDAEDAKGNAFLDTLTLGHLPQIKAKIQQVMAGEGISNDENYVKRRDAEIASLTKEGKEHPIGTMVARGGAALAPMVVAPGAAMSAEAAEAVPFVTRLGKSILNSAKMGGIYGAAQNPGDKEGQVDPLQLKERAEGGYEGAKFGAKVGFAVPVIGEAIANSPKVGRWAAQKFGKIATPVSEETTARYLDNPEAINNAPSRENISNRVLELKKQSDGQVAKAAEDLQTARQSMAESKLDTRAGLQDEKFSAGHELNEAQSKFNEAKQQFKETLKTNNLTHMAGEVTGAVDELKDRVIEGSKDAYAILEKEKGAVDIDPLVKSLQKQHADQFINETAKSPDAAQTAQEIRGWQDRLFNMTKDTGGKLSLPQAKEMMQELDQTLTYRAKQQAGAFAPSTEKALSGLRSEIDASVKGQSEAYREKMKEVAEQAGLLNQTSKLYGTPEKAIQNLNNLDSEKGQAIHVPLLQKLEEHTGKSLKEPVAGYLLNQKVLNTPSVFEDIINSTPEGKALAGARGRMEQISNPERSRALNEKTIAPFQQKVSAAESSLDAAKEKAKNFSGITENSIFSKTKAVSGANSFGPEKQIARIDQEHGTNFDKEIRARNDADQFAKSDANGSRKSVVGGALGTAAGWLLGHGSHDMAILGYAGGHAVGAAADKYSGVVFRKMLDAGIKAGKGTEYLSQAISKLPPEQATAAIMRYKSATKGPDKWALDGYTKLMDHASSADDKEMIANSLDGLMKSKSGQKLLVSASDLKPGSKAMDNVFKQLKNETKTGGE